MSSHEPSDPTLEWLPRLSPLSPDPEATARVRRRCHAAMARRTALDARQERSGFRPGRAIESILMLTIGLYLVAAIAEAVQVAGSL